MAEKDIPVFITRADNVRVQIGTASAPEGEGSARTLDIWPQYNDVSLDNLEFGDSKVEDVEETPVSQDAEPAEGAEAEPVPTTRDQFRKGNNQ